MASRSLQRRGSQSSSDNSDDFFRSGGSGGSRESRKSTSSRETDTYYDPRIKVIRETTSAEKQENPGKTLFLKRLDGEEEVVNSIEGLTAYRLESKEMVHGGDPAVQFWRAYNTIAYFIMEGNIKLQGGKDCFGKLATPKSGVGSLNAGDGIYIKPTSDIHTFGTIRDGSVSPKEVHISSKTRDRHGRVTNAIVLEKDEKYRVAGDVSPPEDVPRGPRRPPVREMLMCHRGRLREAGIEIPGPIHGNDLWYFERSGNFGGTSPITENMWPCNGCYESLCRREWPTPEMCARGDNNCNGARDVIPRMKRKGVKPALPVFECERFLVRKYSRHGWLPLTSRATKTIKKVLDASFAIRDWDHLAEATDVTVHWLVVLFCAVPSLGERLDKRGASFVPWAGDAGLYLGTHARVDRGTCMEYMYEESDDGVIEIFTGEKVRFEEDHNGIIHVERTTEGYSDRVPEGADGCICLG